jgi:hypothetical protein
MARKKAESIDDLLEADKPQETKAQPTLSAEVQQALAKLPTKKAAFVLNVAAGMIPADALLEAGWQMKRTVAGSTASRLLREDEAVKDAVAAIKADMAKRAEYDFAKFMVEMNEAMQFAKDTKNATALVRAIELKGKASGHIVDRVDSRVQTAGFSLVVEGVAPPRPVSEQ